MKTPDDFYLLKEASEHNILALTSRCNCRCLFCSHSNNPPGALVRYCGHRDLTKVLTAIDFLDSRRDIVIGESASPIAEGEPFIYPDFWPVLEAIRQKYEETVIAITTNGTMLTGETVKRLAQFKPLKLNLSLNTLNFRYEVMGDRKNKAKNAPALLAEYGIAYNGSIVALPEITGWDDIAATILHLQNHGCGILRLLLPGYSDLASPERRYNWDQRRDLALSLLKDMPGINLLEPPVYKDNRPIIYGVISGSPGAEAGFSRGDEILKVDGQVPVNRFAAWEMISRQESPEIVLKRGNNILSMVLPKDSPDCGGLVFSNDLDCRRLEEMVRCCDGLKGRGVICCSQLGRPYIEGNISLFPSLRSLSLVTVENRFFGGNIGVAGLLTIDDFNRVLKGENFDYAFLPQDFLDFQGQDLRGDTIDDLCIKGYCL